MTNTWQPDIGDRVAARVNGRVGRVRARNNAIDDEVLVEWTDGGRSWVLTAWLEPCD